MRAAILAAAVGAAAAYYGADVSTPVSAADAACLAKVREIARAHTPHTSSYLKLAWCTPLTPSPLLVFPTRPRADVQFLLARRPRVAFVRRVRRQRADDA